MCVHLFGSSWSLCTANYALKRTAAEFGSDVSEMRVNTILRNFYADDCLCACGTVSEGQQLVQELTLVLARAGFHLSQWIGNRQEELSTVTENDRNIEAKSIQLAGGASQDECTLGVRWNVTTDDTRRDL